MYRDTSSVDCALCKEESPSRVFLRLQIEGISTCMTSHSDRVGLPLHNIPSSRLLMRSIGAEFLRPDALLFLL